MHVYQIGYYSYEESPQRYLVHDLKFEEDEFRQLILTAVEEIVKDWLKIPMSGEFFERDLPCRKISRFDAFVPESLAAWLIRERGFRELEVTAQAVFDGWARVLPDQEEGFPLSKCPVNQAVTARLMELGLQEAILEKHKEFEEYERKLCEDG